MFLKVKIFTIICFVLIAAPFDALANGKVRSLTDSNIRDFVEKTTHMSKPKGEYLSVTSVQSYLEKHLATDSSFATTITYHIPEMPAQSMSMTFDKSKFIDTVKEGAETIEGYDNKVKITDIQINWWANKAHVKTENTETGFMAVPTPDGSGAGELVSIEGKSTCAQVIELNKGVIQLKNAVCKTNIEFGE